MRQIAFLLLAVPLALACNGHSPSETVKAAPTISDLSYPATATLLAGQGSGAIRFGELPISFSFVAPEGDITQVIVTLPQGVARNPLEGVVGRTSGTAGLIQSVVLPAAGQKVPFSVQVEDSHGDLSNSLAGVYVSP
jgi:hypothetical protein